MRTFWQDRKRKNRNSKYYWIEKSTFVEGMIKLLQKELNKTDNDIRLRYRSRVSFPKKWRAIQIEFPDGVVRRTKEELDAIAEELLGEFALSPELKKAGRTLYLFAEDSRNCASECEISYVLATQCGQGGGPGVIVYWSK